MFRVVPSSIAQRSSLASEVWRLDTIVDTVRMLGWHGEIKGPVDFDGVRMITVCSDKLFGAPGSGWLLGCLVPGHEARVAVQTASLLAGYSSRAVLVREFDDIVDLQLETALLDQGAVLEAGGELRLLSMPGPVSPSPLQGSDKWRTDACWLSMRDAITSAETLARV